MMVLEGARIIQGAQQKAGSEGEIRQQVLLKPSIACVCQREREREVERYVAWRSCMCVCVCVIKQDCVWSLRVPGERLVSRQAVTEHILKAKTCLIPVALVHLPLSKALFSVATRLPSIAFVLNCTALIL